MKLLWSFGGTYSEFGEKISKGFNKIQFGRHNVDYSNVDGFLEKIQQYSIPDIIIFNMSPNTHYIDFNKKFTPRKDIETLKNLIDTNFYFQLRLTEWFFSNHSNKRILFLTSQECNSIVDENINLDDEIFEDGDLLLYRMSRALEHQIIHTQNVLKQNHINNNIIMGICVGYNDLGTPEYLNKILHADDFRRNVLSIGKYTIESGTTFFPKMISSDDRNEYKLNPL